MGQMLKDIDAVIFDMDGTLIDSMWIWVAVDKEYLKKYHLTEPDNFHENMEGKSFTEVAGYYIEAFPSLNKTIQEIVSEWHEMAYDKYMHEAPLKNGAREFLEEMRAQGKKTAIATSNSRVLALDTLKALGIDQLFDVVKTSGEVGIGKPAPDVYLAASRALQTAPERCLVFEDVPAGIMAGKNAGMRVCAVADKYSEPLAAKKKELADYFIQDYSDIKCNSEKENHEVL